MKKELFIVMFIILLVFIVGCAEEIPDGVEELDISDEELDTILGEEEDTALVGEAAVIPLRCTDTDGGEVSTEYGEVTQFFRYEGRRYKKIFRDKCQDDGRTLKEFYCDGKRRRSKLIACEQQGCVDGACEEFVEEFTCPSGTYLSGEGVCVDLPLAACEEARTFSMLVLIDDNSYEASNDEIIDYFDFASDLLFERTCTHIDVLNIEHVNILNEEQINEVINQFLLENEDLVRDANGFVLFSGASESALLHGGHVWNVVPSEQGITEYCNTFANPGSRIDLLYGSIIDWTHRFGECGYDFDHYIETGEWLHVSDTSLDDGSCHNQAGILCIFNNGYYMCENLLDEYYASDPRIMTAGSIIHEIMHSFAGTVIANVHSVESEECLTAYRGMLDDFICEYNLGDCFFNICRYTYENFILSVNYCEGGELPEPDDVLPDLNIWEIVIEDNEAVVRGCNSWTPIPDNIEFELLINRGSEVLYNEIQIRETFGVGCDSGGTVRMPLGSIGVSSGDTIEVAFEWDPYNKIEETNEDNNIASETFVIE